MDQLEGIAPVFVHMHPGSIWQPLEQQSPPARLPSSHCSAPLIQPLPQAALDVLDEEDLRELEELPQLSCKHCAHCQVISHAAMPLPPPPCVQMTLPFTLQ